MLRQYEEISPVGRTGGRLPASHRTWRTLLALDAKQARTLAEIYPKRAL